MWGIHPTRANMLCFSYAEGLVRCDLCRKHNDFHGNHVDGAEHTAVCGI